MNAVELKNFIRATLVTRRTVTQEYTVFDALIDFITQAVTEGIPSWTALLTFNTDGTAAGAFTTYEDIAGNLRFWKTKADGNVGHAPPTAIDVHEDAWWLEVSPSDGSSIKEWTPGIYQSGLQIVYFDVTGAGKAPALFLLANSTRPFTSSDFLTELGDGDWISLGSYDYEIVNTGAAPINVNCDNQARCAFKGSVAIGAAKTWNFTNAAFLREAIIRFELSTADIQTFNGVLCNDGAWNSATHQWTPPVAGKYKAIATSDGVDIYLEIFGPFN